MSPRRFEKPWLVITLLVVGGTVHLASALPQLPDPVATHFGVGGRPNGWMSQRGLILFELLLVALITLCFAGTDQLFRRLPLKLLNLPHKEYWFAPQRREATLQRLTGLMLWTLAWSLVLVIAVNQLLILAHRAEGGPRLAEGAFLGVLGVWVLGLLASIWRLYRLLPAPPGA
ncbi:MAG: DUF1648 domain-containing protein [Myxococcota bacterium]|nr:DUF1648 domain-containing protein [Myxococcota bacterium]